MTIAIGQKVTYRVRRLNGCRDSFITGQGVVLAIDTRDRLRPIYTVEHDNGTQAVFDGIGLYQHELSAVKP